MFWKKKKEVSKKDVAIQIMRDSGMYTNIMWDGYKLILFHKSGSNLTVDLSMCYFTRFSSMGDVLIILGMEEGAILHNGQLPKNNHCNISASPGRARELWDILDFYSRPDVV